MQQRSYSFLQTDAMVVESGKPGPTLMVLGGVHGNETCGVEVVRKFMEHPEEIKLLNGKLILMYGNLPAIRRRERQGAQNLNRVFLRDEKMVTEAIRKSYEYKRALKIRAYLDQADVLLDLHSVTNIDATPFVIGGEKSLQYAKYFDVSIACSGLSLLHAGSTDGYMEECGKVGLCLECGSHDDPNAVQIAEKGVRNLMQALGMVTLDESREEVGQKRIHVSVMYQNAHGKFTLARTFAEFEPIKKGTLIGHDGDVPVFAKHSGVIMFARTQEKLGADCFCLAREM